MSVFARVQDCQKKNPPPPFSSNTLVVVVVAAFIAPVQRAHEPRLMMKTRTTIHPGRQKHGRNGQQWVDGGRGDLTRGEHDFVFKLLRGTTILKTVNTVIQHCIDTVRLYTQGVLCANALWFPPVPGMMHDSGPQP